MRPLALALFVCALSGCTTTVDRHDTLYCLGLCMLNLVDGAESRAKSKAELTGAAPGKVQP